MCFIKIYVLAATHVGGWRCVPFGVLDLIVVVIGFDATFHTMMAATWDILVHQMQL